MYQKTGISASGLALALIVAFGIAPLAFAETNDEGPIVGTPTITEGKALEMAVAEYAGTGKFTDLTLEMEGSVLVYAVEFTESDGNEVDVKVDAKSGIIVLVENDKDEPADDDAGDLEEDDSRVASMQTLVDLLNQLITLLRAQLAKA